MDFQTGHFADFKLFKINSHFANFGKVKIDFTCLGNNYFIEFGQMIRPQKITQTLSVRQKFQELHTCRI